MTIQVECSKCGCSVQIEVDDASSLRKCPQCKAVLPTSNIKALESSNVQEQTWTMSTGRKKRRGLSQQKIRDGWFLGKIPSTVFLSPDDQTDDWQQLVTLSWLADEPQVAESRYCPACNARVRGPTPAIDRRQRCPECADVVQFIDFLRF